MQGCLSLSRACPYNPRKFDPYPLIGFKPAKYIAAADHDAYLDTKLCNIPDLSRNARYGIEVYTVGAFSHKDFAAQFQEDSLVDRFIHHLFFNRRPAGTLRIF